MIRRAPPRGAAQAGGKTTSTMRSVVIRNRAQSGVCTRCRLKRHHLAEAIRLDVSRTCRSSRTKRESRPSFRANCGPVAEVRPEQGRIGCIPPVWDIVLFDPDRTVCGFDGSACLQPRRRPLSPGGAGRPGPGEVEIAPPMSASVAPICTSSTATAMGRHLSGLPPARRHACRHLESTGIGSFASPSGGWVQGTDRPLAGAPFGHDAAEQDHARRDPRPPPGPSLHGWGRACGTHRGRRTRGRPGRGAARARSWSAVDRSTSSSRWLYGPPEPRSALWSRTVHRRRIAKGSGPSTWEPGREG